MLIVDFKWHISYQFNRNRKFYNKLQIMLDLAEEILYNEMCIGFFRKLSEYIRC